MSDRIDPFTGRELQPDQARGRKMEIDPNDPRMGVPPDKMGAYSLPLKQPDGRQAVIYLLFPPVELRDQPYEVVERAVFAQGAGLLRGIAQEIYKSYTSDPLDSVGAQNLITAFQAHVDEMRRGGR